jgi:CHC2-type zinc finger protein
MCPFGRKRRKLSMVVSREYITAAQAPRPLRVNKTVLRFSKDRLPSALSFYEAELGKLTRPNRRGWTMADCPFHKSKSHRSLSVNLEHGGFHCFGCDARGGGLIDFVMLRNACDFKSAATKLGAWQDVSDVDRYAIAQQSAEREKKRAEEARLERLAHEQRIQLRDEIHTTARIQRETSDRLGQILQGVTPAHDDEADLCWAILSLALDDLRTTENAYMKLAGLEYAA